MSETIVKITGMTCGHCEGRVSAELGKLEGVSEVKASAGDAQAVITSSGALDADAISRAVITAGYRVSAQLNSLKKKKPHRILWGFFML